QDWSLLSGVSQIRPNLLTRYKPMLTSSPRILIAFALVLLLVPFGYAQTVSATLEGRVTDSTGAVLPKATVTAVNKATGITRSTVSSASGDYQISLLPVGDYTVTAELAGF